MTTRKFLATAVVLAATMIVTTMARRRGPSIQGDSDTVTIVNYLLDTVVTVHCQSKDDDLGFHDLGYMDDYSWSFSRNTFEGTLFWCNLEIARTGQCLHFDAFDQKLSRHVRYWEVHGVEGMTGKTQGGVWVHDEVAKWGQCT